MRGTCMRPQMCAGPVQKSVVLLLWVAFLTERDRYFSVTHSARPAPVEGATTESESSDCRRVRRSGLTLRDEKARQPWGAEKARCAQAASATLPEVRPANRTPDFGRRLPHASPREKGGTEAAGRESSGKATQPARARARHCSPIM